MALPSRVEESFISSQVDLKNPFIIQLKSYSEIDSFAVDLVAQQRRILSPHLIPRERRRGWVRFLVVVEPKLCLESNFDWFIWGQATESARNESSFQVLLLFN